MPISSQRRSGDRTKHVSIRFKEKEHKVIVRAATMSEETFQRFAVSRLLQAASEIIEKKTQTKSRAVE